MRTALLLALPALALAACAGPQATTCDLLVEAIPATAEALPEPANVVSGPMLGYVTHREVAIWAQLSSDDASLAIRYWPVDDPDTSWITDPVIPGDGSWGAVELALIWLEPGTTYGYELIVDGEPVADDRALEFTTQQLWQWRTDPPEFSAAFGSCSYAVEAEYDRPGDPYGGDYGIFDTIAGLDPDLMLWLGDNIYFREVDWDSLAGMAYRYSFDRARPELQNLLAATHHYAAWDDHDFGPNDSDRSWVHKLEALELFDLFWANPSSGMDGADGNFTMFSYNDIDFFVLDTRFWRSPKNEPQSTLKTMLGQAQLQWFIDALTTSRAPFKIVVSGSQFVNDVDAYETWARYADERQVILDAIVARQINGVVFISGDRHHGELQVRTPDGGYPIYDFTSSPLTAGLGDARYELENPLRVDGTFILGQRNFGLLHFSGPRTSRTLTMEARNSVGETLWTHTIEAAELSFPQPSP